MNLHQISGFSTKTLLLTQTTKFFFPKIIQSIPQHKTSYQSVNLVLKNYQFFTLPFLIKLKFVTTIKTPTPVLQYIYVHPSSRMKRSNLYVYRLNQKLLKSSTASNITSFYSQILKI